MNEEYLIFFLNYIYFIQFFSCELTSPLVSSQFQLREKVVYTSPVNLGIASPATFHELPNEMLSSHSNVGQPGKWMFRIDDVIGACPAGAQGPPLCDKGSFIPDFLSSGDTPKISRLPCWSIRFLVSKFVPLCSWFPMRHLVWGVCKWMRCRVGGA